MSPSPSPDPAGATGDYFSGLAGVYARFRPGYPATAFDFMLSGLAPPITAVDVGCGTGISSRGLAAAGVTVIAVDPNQDMLDEASRHPARPKVAIDYRRGSADELPVPDDTATLVLCAQSYHWFGSRETLEEFHRVLIPNGRLALMWNVRETGDSLSAGYERIMSEAQNQAQSRGRVLCRARSATPDTPDLFGPAHRERFPNPQTFDAAGWIGRARSASYFPPEGDPRREEYETALRRLFDTHARDGTVTLRERTEVTMVTARSRDA
ncbi:MAG: class I SAM-dependent methyltransferase [Phycisphaerales bacterium]|nr:class I SAM-dependent methyltransferase [Phycisphaerales bacterium]